MSYMPKAKSDVHITPDRVWSIIKDSWGYSQEEFFDPCPVNPTFDGLKTPWKQLNYVNPPYSRIKGDKKSLLVQFVAKAISENKQDKITVMLLPSKTEQQWFHDLLNLKYEIIWVRKRLKFKNNKDGATQPHFLVRVS